MNISDKPMSKILNEDNNPDYHAEFCESNSYEYSNTLQNSNSCIISKQITSTMSNLQRPNEKILELQDPDELEEQNLVNLGMDWSKRLEIIQEVSDQSVDSILEIQKDIEEVDEENQFDEFRGIQIGDIEISQQVPEAPQINTMGPQVLMNSNYSAPKNGDITSYNNNLAPKDPDHSVKNVQTDCCKPTRTIKYHRQILCPEMIELGIQDQNKEMKKKKSYVIRTSTPRLSSFANREKLELSEIDKNLNSNKINPLRDKSYLSKQYLLKDNNNKGNSRLLGDTIFAKINKLHENKSLSMKIINQNELNICHGHKNKFNIYSMQSNKDADSIKDVYDNLSSRSSNRDKKMDPPQPNSYNATFARKLKHQDDLQQISERCEKSVVAGMLYASKNKREQRHNSSISTRSHQIHNEIDLSINKDYAIGVSFFVVEKKD